MTTDALHGEWFEMTYCGEYHPNDRRQSQSTGAIPTGDPQHDVDTALRWMWKDGHLLLLRTYSRRGRSEPRLVPTSSQVFADDPSRTRARSSGIITTMSSYLSVAVCRRDSPSLESLLGVYKAKGGPTNGSLVLDGLFVPFNESIDFGEPIEVGEGQSVIVVNHDGDPIWTHAGVFRTIA